MKDSKVSEEIIGDLQILGMRCANAGLRYGSVAYMCFGELIHGKRYDRYQAEIELGADSWTLYQKELCILSSAELDILVMIRVIENALIGQDMLGIYISGMESTIALSNSIKFVSQIKSSYASDFLYAYNRWGVRNLVTLNGLTFETDL